MNWRAARGAKCERGECQALTARPRIGEVEALLVKPQTFMNLSGAAVKALVDKHGIASAASVLVISDDLVLPFGRLRIRREGSAGRAEGIEIHYRAAWDTEFSALAFRHRAGSSDCGYGGLCAG